MPSYLPIATGFKGRKARVGLSALRSQSAELEQLRQATGAREIEQDKPGALARIVDFLSRPNYSIAGFAEEVFGEQPSVSRGVKRALAEIFSGIGGIQGEKRAFGEVLENLGVGTKTLADAFPALEGTWVGAMGSRGAAGLMLDIATDPLTYMTFGAATGTRIATSKGVRYLNKSGADEFGKLFRKNLDQIPATKTDDVAVTRRFDQARVNAEKEFESLYSTGDDIAGDYLEKGGAKLFGKYKLPGSDKLGVPLRKSLEMLPDSISKPAVEGATQMRDGMMRVLNGIFSKDGALANLPQPLRERATRLTNSFFRSSIAHRSRLMGEMAPLEKTYRRLAKKDPSIGERWYDVREGVKKPSVITDPEELDAFQKTMALYDSMGQTLHQSGVLGDAQILPNYIFHQYKNVEDLAQYHPRPGVKLDKGSKANFEKERKFQTYRIAQEESERLHSISLHLMSRKEADRLYPVLEPEFDVFKNMQKYIGQHSEVLARKAWREEMVDQFGKSLDEFDFDAVYEVGAKGPPGTIEFPRVGATVSGLKVRGHVPNQSSISASLIDYEILPGIREVRLSDFTGTPDSTKRTRALAEEIRTSGEVNPLIVVEDVDGLYVLEGGHRWDALHEIGVESVPAMVVRDLEDLPTISKGVRRAIDEGDIESTLTKTFGEDGAQYVAVKAKQTGDELVYLPKAIAQRLEGVNSRLFNTQEYKGFAKLLKGFDWLNNNFKWGVYTVWPASATRDAYSNIFLSGLRIGINSIDPKRHMDAIRLLAGRDLAKEFAGSGYTIGQLRDLAKTFGVNVPGQVFVEQTGKFKLGKFRKALTEKRALIENEARVLLWLDEIRNGVDPRSAADTVGKFLFNYGEVSGVERDVFRRLIPFYCVPTTYKALTSTGWKLHSELKRGDSLLTYNIDDDVLEWKLCDDVAVFDYNDEISTLETRGHTIRCTPNHKWPVMRPARHARRDYGKGVYNYPSSRSMTETDSLTAGDRIVTTALLKRGNKSLLTPEEARLFGWIITDGSYRWRGGSLEAVIYQKKTRYMLEASLVAGGKESVHPGTGVSCFRVPASRTKHIKQYLVSTKSESDWVPLVCGLSRDAAEAMYDAMYKADGTTAQSRTGDFLACQCDAVKSAFRVLATMLGKRASDVPRGSYVSHRRHWSVHSMRRGFEWFKGQVWCPSTANGTWVMMTDDGTITVTGNTFTRKNVQLQAKMLRENPGRVINQVKPFRGYNEENEEMVRWEGEALKLRLDKDGKTLHTLTGIDLPLRNLDTIWSGGFGATGRRMMGMMTPVLKVPLEATVGRDLFTGGEMKRSRVDTLGRIVEATNTPKPLRDWLGYKKEFDEAGRPRYTMDGVRYAMLVKSWMFSRAFSTSDRVFREYLNDPNITRGLLDVMTGIRAKQIDMNEMQERKLKNRIRQLEGSLVRRGELREFTRAYTPKER